MEPRELLKSERSVQSQVDIMLERARWAAGRFATFDRARTLAIARCCSGALLAPNQASLVMLTRKSARDARRRTSSGKIAS